MRRWARKGKKSRGKFMGKIEKVGGKDNECLKREKGGINSKKR